MTDRDVVSAAADAIADGNVPEWAKAEASASAAEREDLRQLQIIAEIAAVHRRSAAGAAETHDGPRWGPLVLRGRIGGGAFGEVFRAWDTSLDREVALKLLRRRQRAGAESIIREGQLLAKISHPNVMAVHGAREIDGQVGIWGEFLHGRTLADIVSDDGPMSADETMVVADAICRGLSAAHRVGLLHRDVKAQNVIRERGGRIVLMDFGLGCERTPEGTSPEPGLAGTPLYMAPELLAGSAASTRTDVYSLGVLMFFLVTGAYPVAGSTLDEITAAHKAGRRATVQDLRPELPGSLVQIIERAIDPDPARRFQSAGEVRNAIAAVTRPLAPPAAPVSLARTLRQPRVLALLGVLLAATVGSTWWLTARSLTVAPRPPRLIVMEPPAGTRFSDSSRNTASISPDGSTLAVTATDNASGQLYLWLYSFETGQYRLVPGSDRALAAFWAPDSKSIGFFEPAGTMRRMTLDGVPIGSSPTAQEPRGATWNRAGEILFTKGSRSGLYTVRAAETAEKLVLAPDAARGELAFQWPQFLPDGRRFIFFTLSNDAAVRGIYLASLDGGSHTLLVNTDDSAVISGSALLYVRNGSLLSQRFNADGQRVEGQPIVIQRDVATNYDHQSMVTASEEGTIAFVPAQDDTELVWFDRKGQQVDRFPVKAARFRSPALSRDGTLLAVQQYHDGLSEIQVFDAKGVPRTPIAQSADVALAVWGPQHRLAYASIDSGKADIYEKDFDRDTQFRLVYAGPPNDDSDKMPTDWSFDGSLIVFDVLSKATRDHSKPYAVWTVPIADPAHAAPFLPGEGGQVLGRLSPDGRSIVYVRRPPPTKAGQPPSERELWSCDFPSGDHGQLIAVGGIDPAWPSNREISYFDRSGRFTIVALGRGNSVVREPVSIAPGVNTPEASRNNYAWAPDGQRVLFNRPVRDSRDSRVMVLMNARTPN